MMETLGIVIAIVSVSVALIAIMVQLYRIASALERAIDDDR